MKKVLPILFDGYMHSGGSTKPWLIKGIAENNVAPVAIAYVAKTFTTNHIKQGHSIAKEFLCNALATEFDLAVPNACLVNLHDEDFKATLDEEALRILGTKYQGMTYASELLDASIINEQIKGPFGIADCATLFAFDCMIFNSDLGGWRNKPNLLVDDDGFILIDHELTLHFIDNEDPSGYQRTIENLQDNVWPTFYERHIFYSRLKSYRGTKKHLFDTFEQSLMTLDISFVDLIIKDLIANSVEVGAIGFLIDYLSILRQSAHKFRNILSGLIS